MKGNATGRDRQRQALFEATHDLIRAGSVADIAAIVTDTISELVGLSQVGVHLHDADAGALVPVEWTDSVEAAIDEPPALGEGSLAWDVFRAGEPHLFADLSTEPTHNPDTPFDSEFIIPLDDEGVVLVASPDPAAFDEGTRQLVEMVCANATAALERLERERELSGFKKAVEHAGHSIVITDTDGTIEYVNPAFEEITGYTREEALGANPRILKSGFHEDELYARLWRTILDGEVWHAELVNERKDGERFVVNQTIAPIVDDEGRPQRFVAVNHDITERKEMERQLQEQRDNLDLLNEVVRHDIRNDLQLVLSYTELLGESLDDADREYLDKLVDRAENAVDLTETARDMAEVMLQADPDLESVALGAVLEAEVEDLRSAYPAADVSVEAAPRVVVEADHMLDSVFRNLLKNAVQHNEGVPEVTVSGEVKADTVTVRIADNGPGVPDERKEDIFGKGEKGLDSKGTGIGLHLVRTLVDTYGGDVWVEDNDPTGAVFCVELSLAE
ncbi:MULTISPECIES: PAS domain S-box protein [Salinibaculum]|uniref:PAS domain S-box protein n=1 Tax=Salinibaculum TaxID=2732368 RepID=UPI0030CB3E52